MLNCYSSFIYTGEICLEDFDVACEVVRLASLLGLTSLSEECNNFLWSRIYPKNMWRAYKCAENANDTQLKEMALKMAKLKTDEALMDPQFTEVSQAAVVDLMKQDELNVSSEVRLYEAALRWGMAEVARRGLPPGPQSLR